MARTFSIPNYLGRLLLGILLVALAAPLAMAGGGGRYKYRLCDFNGPVPSLWARIAVDASSGEVYTLNLGETQVQIFNKAGMLLYSFGHDLDLAGAADLAAGDDGEIYIAISNAARPGVLRVDYRGRQLSFVGLNHLPSSYLPFRPMRIDYRSGKLYLFDNNGMRLVVLGTDGRFIRGADLKALIKKRLPPGDKSAQREVTEMEIDGFCVDDAGDVYFTAPTLFTAFRLTPSGKLEPFGKQGSGPGKFGVISGIAVDNGGDIYVADKLRCVVMVFDRNFKFLHEFGFKGSRPGNLTVPGDVAVDSHHGDIYVAQAANRGVSAFKLASR